MISGREHFTASISHMPISQPNPVKKSRNYDDVYLNEHLCYELGAKIQHKQYGHEYIRNRLESYKNPSYMYTYIYDT
jgi:hypothetical protein